MDNITKKYYKLLKRGLTYEEIDNMIDLDYSIVLKKNYAVFDDKITSNDITYLNGIKTVLRHERDYEIHKIALYNAYVLLYMAEKEYLNENKKSLA